MPRSLGEWAWHENPFAHTQAFKGLVVVNLMINNWDWKTSNNRIYDIMNPDGTVDARYLVRDLGASFGESDAPALARVLGARVAQGNRNNLEDFERQGFIKAVYGNRVEFDYAGSIRPVVDTVTPGDVVWTCGCCRACQMSNGTRRSPPEAIRPIRPRGSSPS